jgi:hypothetical protein
MIRAAVWTAIASAVLAAIGVVFLVAMYTAFGLGSTSAGQALGRVNDVMVMVSYPLAVPSLLVLRGACRSGARFEADVATVIGIGASAAIAVLQGLLVADALTFEQQVGPVSVALLAFGVALALLGDAGRRSSVLPDGRRMGLIGATYVGYPVWAWWVGRRLRTSISVPRAERPTDPEGAPGRSRSVV